MRLPQGEWMLFGMGARRKLLYREGVLSDALTGEVVRRWEITSEKYEPDEYRVTLRASGEGTVRIEEDAQAVWITWPRRAGRREAVTVAPLRLPRFSGPRAGLLGRLHQEILVNIVDGRPVPNLWVYPRPWYRDAAMMLLCLERTGNLALVSEWIMGLRDPFDRNNAGHEEPDNLGQALWMIAQANIAAHPLIPIILNTLPRFAQTRGNITYIEGLSDFAPHPVYQTQWLKYGLRALGLPDRYTLPQIDDRYAWLFWMDGTVHWRAGVRRGRQLSVSFLGRGASAPIAAACFAGRGLSRADMGSLCKSGRLWQNGNFGRGVRDPQNQRSTHLARRRDVPVLFGYAVLHRGIIICCLSPTCRRAVA